MSKRKPVEDKRVHLNCMVTPATLEWLRAASLSQGEAVDFAVDVAKMAEAQGRLMPARRSRREREVAARAASDLTAQAVGRPEIDYSDIESTPMTHVATLDAVGPRVDFGRGKASVENWRAGRKPILKPGDKR